MEFQVFFAKALNFVYSQNGIHLPAAVVSIGCVPVAVIQVAWRVQATDTDTEIPQCQNQHNLRSATTTTLIYELVKFIECGT